MSILTLIYLALSVLTVSSAQILLKKGTLEIGEFTLSWPQLVSAIQNKWMMLGTLLFILSYVFYILALSKTQLNIAQPLTMASSMILALVGAYLFLGEPFSSQQIIGIAMILAGMFLVVIK